MPGKATLANRWVGLGPARSGTESGMGKKLPGKFAGRKFQALDTGGNQGDGRRARARPEGECINRPVTHAKKLKNQKMGGGFNF